jgi:hypothetical protein
VGEQLGEGGRLCLGEETLTLGYIYEPGTMGLPGLRAGPPLLEAGLIECPPPKMYLGGCLKMTASANLFFEVGTFYPSW